MQNDLLFQNQTSAAVLVSFPLQMVNANRGIQHSAFI
jgi:hypothetical protein